jgi:hypothetical protein
MKRSRLSRGTTIVELLGIIVANLIISIFITWFAQWYWNDEVQLAFWPLYGFGIALGLVVSIASAINSALGFIAAIGITIWFNGWGYKSEFLQEKPDGTSAAKVNTPRSPASQAAVGGEGVGEGGPKSRWKGLSREQRIEGLSKAREQGLGTTEKWRSMPQKILSRTPISPGSSDAFGDGEQTADLASQLFVTTVGPTLEMVSFIYDQARLDADPVIRSLADGLEQSKAEELKVILPVLRATMFESAIKERCTETTGVTGCRLVGPQFDQVEVTLSSPAGRDEFMAMQERKGIKLSQPRSSWRFRKVSFVDLRKKKVGEDIVFAGVPEDTSLSGFSSMD